MKTRIFVFVFAGLVALSIYSCTEDVLEADSTTQISSATFWKTRSDVDLALNGVYDKLGDLEQNYVYFDMITDNGYNNYPWEGFKAIADGTHDNRNPAAINSIWDECLRGIGRANVVLDNYETVEGLSEEYKKSVRGESLFLRAYFYFRLADLYGGVPLILESPKLEHGELPRDSKEAVVNQVITDLEEAASLLPTSQANTGKATQGAALALKARVHLYNEQWPEAAASAEEVMGMSYSLFPNYRDLFREANENNEEVIFDVQFISPEDGNFFELFIGGVNYGGWSSIVALPNLAEDYLMSDGLPADESPLFDPDNPYENRDPRLKQTLFVPGSTTNGVENGTVGDFTEFNFKKYTEYDEEGVVAPTPWPTQTGMNAIILRLAEMMLTYAEAKNELSGPDASVYEAVNTIRARPSVNMPPLPAGLTKEQMREAIRHERRIELVLEGTRYSDIRRWRIAEDVMNGLVDPGGTRTFNPNRDYLWPIPGKEFDIEGTQLEQNPGY